MTATSTRRSTRSRTRNTWGETTAEFFIRWVIIIIIIIIIVFVIRSTTGVPHGSKFFNVMSDDMLSDELKFLEYPPISGGQILGSSSYTPKPGELCKPGSPCHDCGDNDVYLDIKLKLQ
jgi:hypothetical protein